MIGIAYGPWEKGSVRTYGESLPLTDSRSSYETLRETRQQAKRSTACPQGIRSILGVSLMPCKVWSLRVQTGQIRQGAAGAAYGKIGSPGKRCRGCFIADRGLWPLHPDAGGFGQAERRPRAVLRGWRIIIFVGASCWRCGCWRPGRARSAAQRGCHGRDMAGENMGLAAGASSDFNRISS